MGKRVGPADTAPLTTNAEVRIMPMWVVDPLRGNGFVALWSA